MKKLLTIMMSLVLVFALSACSSSSSSSSSTSSTSSSYKDGTYTGRSSDFEADESGNGAGYGEVTLEIKNNKIISCDFVLYELDGTVKDDTYGADLSKENRLKAQKAVQSAKKYAAALIESNQINEVDTLSGATISHSEFVEAVNDALKKAAE